MTSTLESIQNQASSAYNNPSSTPTSTNPPPSDTSNASQDIHGNAVRKGDLKDQLNEAVLNLRREESREEGAVENICTYIPFLPSNSHSHSQSEGTQETRERESRDKALPRRPEHDMQVEQFLRKQQYCSRSGDDPAQK